MITAKTLPMGRCNVLFMLSQFREKNWVLPIEKVQAFVQAKKYDNVTTTPNYPFFRSIICQVVAYGRLKTKENFKLSARKVVAVAYERWSIIRGSKYSDLTWKLLVFWKTGR